MPPLSFEHPGSGSPTPRQSSGSRVRGSGASRRHMGCHRARRDQPLVNSRIHPPRDADAGPPKHPIGAGHFIPLSTAVSVIAGPGISSLSAPPSGASLPPPHRTGASQPGYPSALSQAVPAATIVTPAVTQRVIMAMPLPSVGGSQPQISAPLSSGSTQPMDATSASAGLIASPSPVPPPSSCTLHRVPNGL